MNTEEKQYVLVLLQEGIYTSCSLIGTREECLNQVREFGYLPLTDDGNRWISQNYVGYQAEIRPARLEDLGKKPAYVTTLVEENGTPYSNRIFYDKSPSGLEGYTYCVLPL